MTIRVCCLSFSQHQYHLHAFFQNLRSSIPENTPHAAVSPLSEENPQSGVLKALQRAATLPRGPAWPFALIGLKMLLPLSTVMGDTFPNHDISVPNIETPCPTI